MSRRNLILSIIILVSMVSSACVGIIWWTWEKEEQAKAAMVDHKKEKESVLKKVEARQEVSETAAAKPIDLRFYTNSTLADSYYPKGNTNNNLGELPTDSQIFGGIPFNIAGRIQLWGSHFAPRFIKKIPKEVKGIKISAKCEKIHLFHGALFVNQEELAIAQLVLHYEDGSSQKIPIVTGQHVLNWVGPLAKIGTKKKAVVDGNISEKQVNVTAKGSELAWVGSNPYIREAKKKTMIRLYKSTFENPHPGAEISTIDYVSTSEEPASFLIGLTIE